jgi:hypothetical protein
MSKTVTASSVGPDFRVWRGGVVVLPFVLLLTSCGVAKSDEAYWQSSRDIGGARYQFGPSTDAGSKSPPPTMPTGTAPPPLQGAGGGPNQGAGAGPNQGAGGEPNQGAGGVASAAGSGAVSGGPPPPPPPPGNSGACTFSFRVSTVTANGTYAPRNVGAIWISDAGGKFVKTLQEWGDPRTGRIKNASAWETASGGNTVDAVTGATRGGHGPLTATWDCTDLSKNPIANGSYIAHVTFAESDNFGGFVFFGLSGVVETSGTFVRGSGPVEADLPDTPNFNSMHISLQ